MPAYAVEVEGLVVRYGDRAAVDGVSLTVAEGEVVALLGRNGAGKTSTVETLEGYRSAAAGRVSVLGSDPGEPAGRRRLSSRIGVMLQQGGVYPGMGPGQALGLFASYYANPIDPGDLLERLDLAGVASTPWRRLSGGEQQRLSMALALIGRPKVIFLDEPTAGVDPAGRVTIRSEVDQARQQGAAVLLTTHELAEAERMADRIVIIDRGKVVAQGTVAELTAPAEGEAGIRFSGAPGIDVSGLGEAVGGPAREVTAGEYQVLVGGTPGNVAAVAAWMSARDLPLTELRTASSLEDVFLALTGDEP